MQISESVKSDLEQKHGEILIINGRAGADGEPKWAIALKKPTRAMYKMFRDQAGKGNPDAQENLVIGLCVFPERADFMALLEKFPAIPEAIGKPLKIWMDLEIELSGKE